MADAAASVLSLNTRSMPLLAHLEELRKRIIFSVLGVLVGFISCWSFADRIFGLVQQPIIGALRHHGIGGGLVYLNPTEPFNRTIYSLSICVLSVVAFRSSRPVSQREAVCHAILTQYGWFVHSRRSFWLQDGVPGVPGFLNRLWTTLPTDDNDRRIYEAVCDDNRRSRTDFRNANCRVLLGPDASDHRALDVAESPIFHPRHFCCRGNHHTHCRYPKHVSFRRSDASALCH
jgi:hypothetical protein